MWELRQKSRCHANSLNIRRIERIDCGGFTLVELLLVVLVMLLLMSVYWGSMLPHGQQNNRILCRQNLEKLHLAMQIYAGDSSGLFPAAPQARTSEEPLRLLVPKYDSDPSIFVCPGSRVLAVSSIEAFRRSRISYAYWMGRRLADTNEALASDRLIDTWPKEAGQRAFSTTGNPPANNHGSSGGNILFCDGRVQFVPPCIPFPLPSTQGVTLLNPRH